MSLFQTPHPTLDAQSQVYKLPSSQPRYSPGPLSPLPIAPVVVASKHLKENQRTGSSVGSTPWSKYSYVYIGMSAALSFTSDIARDQRPSHLALSRKMNIVLTLVQQAIEGRNQPDPDQSLVPPPSPTPTLPQGQAVKTLPTKLPTTQNLSSSTLFRLALLTHLKLGRKASQDPRPSPRNTNLCFNHSPVRSFLAPPRL